MNYFKKIIAILLVIVFSFGLCSCDTEKAKSQKILVTMENGKTFTIETKPQYAPKTAENFVELVKSGFYNGLTFHRVIPGFMAQGGDPKGDGTGGNHKKIKGEFASNGFSKNTLEHNRGVVSMARSQDKNSASSQFFICYKDTPHLDGDYAAFGYVSDGMEVVDEFTKIPCDSKDKPLKPIVIKSMEIIE